MQIPKLRGTFISLSVCCNLARTLQLVTHKLCFWRLLAEKLTFAHVGVCTTVCNFSMCMFPRKSKRKISEEQKERKVTPPPPVAFTRPPANGSGDSTSRTTKTEVLVCSMDVLLDWTCLFHMNFHVLLVLY